MKIGASNDFMTRSSINFGYHLFRHFPFLLFFFPSQCGKKGVDNKCENHLKLLPSWLKWKEKLRNEMKKKKRAQLVVWYHRQFSDYKIISNHKICHKNQILREISFWKEKRKFDIIFVRFFFCHCIIKWK